MFPRWPGDLHHVAEAGVCVAYVTEEWPKLKIHYKAAHNQKFS